MYGIENKKGIKKALHLIWRYLQKSCYERDCGLSFRECVRNQEWWENIVLGTFFLFKPNL